MNDAIVRNIRTVTAPPYEPVSLADAKRWCRVDDDITDRDGMISMLITAARERAELITGCVFVQRAVELLMDDLPCGDMLIDLPSPVQGLLYLRYKDSAGHEQELSGSPDPL